MILYLLLLATIHAQDPLCIHTNNPAFHQKLQPFGSRHILITSDQSLSIHQCSLTPQSFCIIEANKLQIEGEGRICVELFPFPQMKQMDPPISINQTYSIYAFRPQKQTKFHIHRYKGHPSIWVGICAINHVSSCVSSLGSPSTILTHFQRVDIDYCSRCLAVIIVECQRDCSLTIGPPSVSLRKSQLQYMQMGTKLLVPEYVCITFMYGFPQPYYCTYQEEKTLAMKDNALMMSYEMNKQIQMEEGIPVYWAHNYTYHNTSSIILVIVEAPSSLSLTVNNLTFHNVSGIMSLTLSTHTHYSFNVGGSASLAIYESNVMSILINHHYPSVSSFHVPAQYILQRAATTHLRITLCTLDTLHLKYYFQGQEENKVKINSLIFQYTIRNQGARKTLYLSVESQNYIVFDLRVSNQKLTPLPEPHRIDIQYRFYHELHSFHYEHFPTQFQFFMAQTHNSLTKALLCPNIVFSNNGQSANVTKMIKNGQFSQWIPKTHKYLGISFTNSTGVYYSVIDLNRSSSWVVFGGMIVLIVLVSMVWIGKHILGKKKVKIQ